MNKPKPISPLQLKRLHAERNKLERISGGQCDRAWFDSVLCIVGQVEPGRHGGEVSSKFLHNRSFERVMAVIEEYQAKFDPAIGTYWRNIERRRGHFLSKEQEHEIHKLYEEMKRAGATYPLASIVFQHTQRRTQEVHSLLPSEAINVIEHLKAVIARQPHQEVQHGH